MALPTLQKTWQISPNNVVTSQGTAVNTDMAVSLKIKEVLTGFGTNPWVVVGSSNSIAASMDGTDRWTTLADIVKASGAHSWIVLRQTGISTNFELCIDCSNYNASNGTIVVSPSAGFTGGTTSARPTATDQMIIINNTVWASGLDVQHVVHGWQTTDGTGTRLIVSHSGTVQSLFAIFDKPSDPTTGWSNPSISAWYATTTTSNATAHTYANLTSSSIMKSYHSAITATTNFSGEGSAGNSTILANQANIGNMPNDVDGSWPIFPVGIFSNTTGFRGKQGFVTDLWWSPSGLNSGFTLPNSDSNRQFIIMGPLVLPWTNNSTTIQLS